MSYPEAQMVKDSLPKPQESRSETLDAFVLARKEDPVLQDELSVGELIAIAKYHLDYVVGLGISGRCDPVEKSVGAQSVASHLEEVLMVIAQALSNYKDKT